MINNDHEINIEFIYVKYDKIIIDIADIDINIDNDIDFDVVHSENKDAVYMKIRKLFIGRSFDSLQL